MTPPEPITVKVKTLTPIWTGDAQRETTYLKATSFVGNMRFWAEALLRSLGKEPSPCNITGTNKCKYDKAKGKTRVCSACSIFGCTGLARSFMLKLSGENGSYIKKSSMIKLECREGRDGKPPRYMGVAGFSGEFNLNIVPNTPSFQEGENRSIINAVLILMLRMGSLGARDQYGCGFVSAAALDNKWDGVISNLEFQEKDSDQIQTEHHPSLKDFFFFKAAASYKDHENPHEDISKKHLPFVIRHDTRKFLKFKTNIDTKVRHFFCGNMRGGRIGTKYNIGLANKTLYGWGWYPRKGRFSEYRDDCLNALMFELKRHSQNLKWKEFASKRDNCKSAKNWPKFLEELLTQTRDKLGED